MVAVVAVARDFAASEGPGPLEAAIFGVLGGAALLWLISLALEYRASRRLALAEFKRAEETERSDKTD